MQRIRRRRSIPNSSVYTSREPSQGRRLDLPLSLAAGVPSYSDPRALLGAGRRDTTPEVIGLGASTSLRDRGDGGFCCPLFSFFLAVSLVRATPPPPRPAGKGKTRATRRATPPRDKKTKPKWRPIPKSASENQQATRDTERAEGGVRVDPGAMDWGAATTRRRLQDHEPTNLRRFPGAKPSVSVLTCRGYWAAQCRRQDTLRRTQ